MSHHEMSCKIVHILPNCSGILKILLEQIKQLERSHNTQKKKIFNLTIFLIPRSYYNQIPPLTVIEVKILTTTIKIIHLKHLKMLKNVIAKQSLNVIDLNLIVTNGAH